MMIDKHIVKPGTSNVLCLKRKQGWMRSFGTGRK